MRYIHYELPSQTIKRLKHLYFVRSENDLQEKYPKAIKWFHKIMSEINQKKVERLIKISKDLADA